MKNKTISSQVDKSRIIEMVYDEDQKQTRLAVFEGNGVTYHKDVTENGIGLKPLPPQSDVVSKKVILFPSEAVEYESESILVEEIQTFIHKYLHVSPFFEKIAAYYVLFSWVYDKFNEVPYLRSIGDYGSGKTRFLQVIGSVCYKPIFAGGATTVSPIFRMLDAHGGTLVLDEADFRFSDKTADIIKVLNNGYAKGFPVLRTEGAKNKFEVKTYQVFSPKIIATRDKFQDKALESRFLIEEMDNKRLRGGIPLSLPPQFYKEALEIRNKLLYWRFTTYHKEVRFEEGVERSIQPRLNQIILPILNVISDKEIKKELIQFVQNYNKELIADRGMTWEADALFALLECYKESTGPTVKDVAEKYNWGEDEKERITSKKMGWILKAKLQLKSYKSRDGYVVPLQDNKERVEILKEKFGISDEDIEEQTGESENNVNNVNVGENENDDNWDPSKDSPF